MPLILWVAGAAVGGLLVGRADKDKTLLKKTVEHAETMIEAIKQVK